MKNINKYKLMLMILLTLITILAIPFVGFAQKTPINKGYLRSNLDGNTQAITNLNNVLTKQTDYTTNSATSTIRPDFAIGYSLLSTNAAFAFLDPTNVDTTLTLAQTCVILVTNNSGSGNWAVTMPANVHSQGTLYVTNITSFTFFQYAQKFTNCVALPLW